MATEGNVYEEKRRKTPSFKGLHPASKSASAAARGASAKTNTRCELVLRRELWRRGLRYRIHFGALPGRPDIIFAKQRLAIFCDGDFWHGRDLEARLARLSQGHNASYWVAKVRRNVERDHRQTRTLRGLGWVVLRFWETDVLRRTDDTVSQIIAVLAGTDLQGPVQGS
jgi:DNA mismatch endonuclease (patch repair protein)